MNNNFSNVSSEEYNNLFNILKKQTTDYHQYVKDYSDNINEIICQKNTAEKNKIDNEKSEIPFLLNEKLEILKLFKKRDNNKYKIINALKLVFLKDYIVAE